MALLTIKNSCRIIVLLLIYTCSKTLSQTVRNSRLTAIYGAKTIITKSDLKVELDDDQASNCKVKVINSEADLDFSTGRLFPETFPCNYNEGDLYYEHYGLPNLDQGEIKLIVTYTSGTKRITKPLILRVSIHPSAAGRIVTKNLGLSVSTLNGYSQPLSSANLGFTYDRLRQECSITMLNGARSWPRYGNVVNDSLTLVDAPCDAFLSSRITYKHSALSSPKTDYLQAKVALKDKSNGTVSTEWFVINIDIEEGETNQPPTFSPLSLLQLEVSQFISTAITPSILSAEDDFTEEGHLVFVVDKGKMSGDMVGSLVSTDDREVDIDSFFQTDVQQLKIIYRPPSEDSNVVRIVRIPLRVRDDSGLLSTNTYELVVKIRPMDTLAPIVTKNTGLRLHEGERLRISSRENLQLANEDNADSVLVTVEHGLRHGTLTIPDQRQSITIDDLDRGRIIYTHDGSNTLSDNIIFKASDGRNEIEFLFPIMVIPVDDSAPVLQVNTGLRIFEGMVYQITPIHLKATDEDSVDSTITYTLVQPYSTVGHVVLRRKRPEDLRGWVESGGLWEKRTTEWTQQDINNGYLHYRHTGPQSTVSSTDRLRFKLRDDHTPPNISPTLQFDVKVMPRDIEPPAAHKDATFHLTVPERQTALITDTVLRFTDAVSNDRQIVYTVTSLIPQSADQPTGSIVYTDTPDVEVSMFTQAEVTKGRISYKPDPTEIGIVPRIITMRFEVQDSSGNNVPDQRLSIFLQPVNDKQPIVTIRPLRVFEDGYVIIMPSNLDATDPDTSDQSLTFTVERPPRVGKLKLQGVEIVQGSKFTKTDISNGGVVYSSNGDADALSDSIVIDVSDGMHHIPAHIRVIIMPVDSPFPTYENGDALIYNLNVNESSVALLSDAFLPKTGVSDDIQFSIAKQPIRGIFSPDAFTLADIEAQRVSYRATQTEIGAESLHDSFNLTVTRGQLLINNKLTPQILIQVTILPVDNNPPVLGSGTTFYVVEGGSSTIQPSHLSIVDVDSPSEDVVCSITTQPQFGYLELSSPAPGSEYPRLGLPISAFSLLDLNQGNVNYKQSIHQGVEPNADSFHISCSDGINIDDLGLTFDIEISPTNDESPRIYVNDFVVEEGRLLQIDLPILNAYDKDIPPNLIMFKILTQPVNGRIYESSASSAKLASEFSLDDIRYMSKIAYQHSGTETTNDSFIIQVSDGEHTSQLTVPIRVLPVDDEVPQLFVNTGLYIEAEVERPEWKYITDKELRAEDLDSPNGNITYKLRQQPVFGFLQRRQDTMGEVWDNVTRSMTFQQWELDETRIRYVHNGRYGVRDVIKLDISDNHKNSQLDQRFYITVETLDRVYPDIVNRGVQLPESQSVILTTDMLSAWDDRSSAESIQFTITSHPKNGRLELVGDPGTRLSTFSQIDLAAGRVMYTHDGSERQLSDTFEFEVTDGFNPLARAFSISIIPVDNQMPVLMIQPIRLREKGSTYITPNQLTARDHDTMSDLIVFSITQPPLFGAVQLSGSPVSQFTQDDLENGRVTYVHTGPEAIGAQVIEDSFKIKVTDGTHNRFFVYPDLKSSTRRSQKVSIQIVAVDDSAPQLVVNRPATSLQKSSSSDQLTYTLTSNNLNVVDKDTTSDFVMYWVIDRPQIGRLVKNGRVTNMWTQDDIDNSAISYELNEGADSDTSDHFTFRVQDGGGNDIPSTVFTLTWSYVSFKHATIQVNETDKFANVTLQRRGSLSTTAFVSINIRDVTTTRGADYSAGYDRQVQFNPGEYEKVWRLELVDDSEYEIKEMLTLELSEPVGTVLESHEWTTLTITDSDDQASVRLADDKGIQFRESVGRAAIKLLRSGDLSADVVVVCNFREGTTRGTDHPALYTDFILRSSAVRFTAGSDEAYCYVDVVDDTYVEPDEYFNVYIEKVEGGVISSPNNTMVTILADDGDMPRISFEMSEYEVTEGEGSVTVMVERKGGDLTQQSQVLLMSRRAGKDRAEPMTDYMPISQTLVFGPGDMRKQVKVTILDDRSMPMMEGDEKFKLILRLPENAMLDSLNSTTITIHDELDTPNFAFAESQYIVSETNGTLGVVIRRYGDLTSSQTIRCITTSVTARGGLDFITLRSDSALSSVKFKPGDREARLNITIIDDSLYEGEETLELNIIPSDNQSLTMSTTVTITDEEDKPVIGFADTHVYVSEPKDEKTPGYARVIVERKGDLSRVSIVTVYTKQGSAKSGADYRDATTELEFGTGVKERSFQIRILYDGEPELRESFAVLLSSDANGVASLSLSRTSIYITDENSVTGLVFPVDPIVVSLRYYDSAKSANEPTNGYPLICVTPCDERHPEYSRTKIICDDEGIDNSVTRYRWKVGESVGRDGIAMDLQTVTSNTFITATDAQTLDSIYFGPGSRVQCVATASSNSVYEGLERESPAVTVSKTEGVCKPQRAGFGGGEPYLTKIKYLGSGHKKYSNHVKLTISIPHRDGMLPAISTDLLSNFEYMLSPSASRVALHRCSNLVRGKENTLNVGWRENKRADTAHLPYQHDRQLRGDKSVRFYSNLDLENCMWQFDGLFKLPELISTCGANVETSGQVQDLTQSYVSLVIPIYVSYVFHSTTAPGGWLHYDLSSKQRVTFVYDTALLLKRGISNVQSDQQSSSELSGRLFLHSVKILRQGNLEVEFQTKTNFYGSFVEQKSGLMSSVMSHDHLQLTFDMELLQSERSFDNPKQTWRFVSQSAVQDYSGSYLVRLVPCIASISTPYSDNVQCETADPLTFQLDVELQQVSDPVAEVFSLNSELTLTRNKRTWLSNNRTGEDLSDVAFKSGEKIYGRVDTRQIQDDSPYDVLVDKVFVCSGKDGFVPKYKPDSEEYGCAGSDSGHLQAHYKILDKSSPRDVTTQLNGIPFNARFAVNDTNGQRLYNMPGVDGFLFDSKPLNADMGRRWFVHVIYSVDTLTDQLKLMRYKRAAVISDLSGVGHGKGTNMAFIYIEEPDSRPHTGAITQKDTYIWVSAVSAVLVLLIIVIIGITVIAFKITRLKARKVKREASGRVTGPESTPMPVNDDEGVIRLDATVCNSEI